jgi:hypothetical protein
MQKDVDEEHERQVLASRLKIDLCVNVCLYGALGEIRKDSCLIIWLISKHLHYGKRDSIRNALVFIEVLICLKAVMEKDGPYTNSGRSYGCFNVQPHKVVV